MSETIREMGSRLAFEALVKYCLASLENSQYSAVDLATGFKAVADLQAKDLEAYNKELEETPVVVKPVRKDKS